MKKILAAVLACMLLLTAIPAMADNVRTSGLYTYEIKGNGTIEITKYKWAESSGDIYVPNMIDGYVVSSIGDNAFNPEYNYPDVASYERAFYTSKAVGVTLPDSVKSIGNFAFMDANLSSINIPASVQHIGDGAFINCTGIQFKVAPNHSYFAEIDGVLYQKQQKELVAAPISTSISIPEGIVSIQNYALYKSSIELLMSADGYISTSFTINLSLPSSLKTIGDHAFEGRRLKGDGNLLPANLVSIGTSAFEGCRLESFEIPASVTSIGQRAFANVGNVNYAEIITIPADSQLTSIPDEAFLNIPHKVIIKSSNITEVGSYAFAGLKDVLVNAYSVSYSVKIDISESALSKIKTWGDYAFYSDTSRSKGTTILNAAEILETLEINEEVTFLPAGFNLLINIPQHVVEIKSKAFTEYVDVVDYYLPSTVKKIATNAFPKGSTFIVDAGSYAELWCSENGFGYSIEGQQDDYSWLN